MKRVLGIIVALISIAGFALAPDASAQNTHNFRISNFDIQYDLSRDSEGRSVLKTTERIVAEFPNYDQNRGLVRAIPTEFDGHSLRLTIESVTGRNGESLEYTSEAENDMRVLRIGSADRYVQGTQIYTITYIQHDVTKYFENTGRDEWYWDTNGVDWKVPIDRLTISATLSDDLVSSRVGEPACYEGAVGVSLSCELIPTSETGYSAAATDLEVGENVTIALGFEKNTFTAYQPSLFERIMSVWWPVFITTAIAGFMAIIGLSIAYARRRDRVKEIEPIAVEYIPPKNTSVLVSSQVITPAGSVFSAQLIDFAVRHFIEIIETKPKSFWSTAEYDIKIITDPVKLSNEEQEVLSDMFGQLPKVGERVALKRLRNNTSYYSRTQDNDKKLTKLIEGEYAIREKSFATSRYFYRWSIAFLVVAVVTLSPVVLLYAGIVALQGFFIRPLTDKGLELRRYLEGLRKYIKAAETERLKLFQGPDTAEKIGENVDVENPGQLVKLYERVLPYAILFGLEKEWVRHLGECYDTTQTQPSWYSGNTAFNAAVFASAMSSFSSAASYSGGSSSSSSGGSSGGGSSGGGGGGGGGGGW